MSAKLVEAASRVLDTHTSRRGFLRRAAMVGTALVAAPATYILRPGSAYGAIVPSECGGGTRCNDGWTDLCCNIHGVNTCPPGNVVAGWWRAEGNTFCDGNSRYYMDCNSASCGGCSCGETGTCAHTCVSCNCQCNHDNCNERKVCCTRFRYGQCNRHMPCIGPITCRVVTCVPPWEWTRPAPGPMPLTGDLHPRRPRAPSRHDGERPLFGLACGPHRVDLAVAERRQHRRSQPDLRVRSRRRYPPHG